MPPFFMRLCELAKQIDKTIMRIATEIAYFNDVSDVVWTYHFSSRTISVLVYSSTFLSQSFDIPELILYDSPEKQQSFINTYKNKQDSMYTQAIEDQVQYFQNALLRSLEELNE